MIFLFFLLSSCLGKKGDEINLTVKPYWTISGFSSGAFMSTQMAVAYSGSLKGVGSVSGGVVYCAEGIGTYTEANCADWNQYSISTNDIIDVLEALETSEDIDSLSNLADIPFYFYSSTEDYNPNTTESEACVELFEALGVTDIEEDYDLEGPHVWPTDNEDLPDCDTDEQPWINNCEYNLAYEIINYLYDDIDEPDDYNFHRVYKFEQETDATGIADTGYAYIPEACEEKEGKCPVHFVLHGCEMPVENIGIDYILNSQFNEVAEKNNIVIIYPQTKYDDINGENTYGCWDFVGFTE